MKRRLWSVLFALASCTGDAETPRPYLPDPGPPSGLPELGQFAFGALACKGYTNPAAFGAVVGQDDVHDVAVLRSGQNLALLPYNTITVAGPDAADFSVGEIPYGGISQNQQSCFFVQIHQSRPYIFDRCELRIEFHPKSTGEKHAVVHVVGDDFDVDLPVTGSAAASASTPLLSSLVRVVSFSSPVEVTFRNTTSSTLVIGDPLLSGAATLTDWNCPAMLTQNGACTAHLSAGGGFGCPTGTFTTSTGAVSVPIFGKPDVLPTLALEVVGPGRVESNPPGIWCGPDEVCNGLLSASTTTLVATTWQRFVGWDEAGTSAACGRQTTCDVTPTNSFLRMTALFGTIGDTTVDVSIVGTGSVRAEWSRNGFVHAITCNANCTLYPGSGASVQLTATSAGFVGWQGDCLGTDAACSLGTVVANRSATATFQ